MTRFLTRFLATRRLVTWLTDPSLPQIIGVLDADVTNQLIGDLTATEVLLAF